MFSRVANKIDKLGPSLKRKIVLCGVEGDSFDSAAQEPKPPKMSHIYPDCMLRSTKAGATSPDCIAR